LVDIINVQIVGFLKAMQQVDSEALAQEKAEVSEQMRQSTHDVSEFLATRRKLLYFNEPQ
jgi:hypothetical protein